MAGVLGNAALDGKSSESYRPVKREGGDKNKGFLDKGVEEDGGGWRGIDGHG